MDDKQSTILIIDDEPAVRQSLGDYLEDFDYNILTADNGQDGLELVMGHRPDLVLLDLRMPGMNGLEFLAQIKEKAEDDTPILVISGTGMIQDVVEAIQLGAWNYLLKPIEDLKVLGHAVDKALERARLVKENSEYRQHLESEIARRTAELQQAQKMESVGLLAGGIAHDFNNLLSPIIGYSEMLLSDFSTQDHRYEDIKSILDAAQKAQELTRKLLAFSRKQILEIEIIDLNSVIANFTKILRRTVRESIAVKFSQTEEAATIKADVSQIEQIIMNLVVNAQDALDGSGHIEISTSCQTPPDHWFERHKAAVKGDYITLEVKDDGVGMDKSTMDRVFDPFFSTKAPSKGTGLGLSTVHGIVKQHGGHIDVASEQGKGTTFTICFPKSNLEAAETTAPPISKIETQGNESILVVEDNEAVRTVIGNILSRFGFRVHITDGPESAIEHMTRSGNDIKLLVTDVIMPGMHGKELYENLRQSFPTLKVLYMSGYSGDILSTQGEIGACVPLVHKPVTVGTLIAKVKEVLGS